MNNRHRRVARLKPQEETARQLLAEIILLKQELEDYKQRTDLAIRYTFDLLMTGDLSNQQRLMINQIKDSLSDD